jgi:hypothetical protein
MFITSSKGGQFPFIYSSKEEEPNGAPNNEQQSIDYQKNKRKTQFAE